MSNKPFSRISGQRAAGTADAGWGTAVGCLNTAGVSAAGVGADGGATGALVSAAGGTTGVPQETTDAAAGAVAGHSTRQAWTTGSPGAAGRAAGTSRITGVSAGA